MIAEPSASNSDSGPSDSVTRVVAAFIVALPFAAGVELRDVAHVERMIGVGIGVARRARIEVAARGGEVGRALADRVQVDAVHARLQARHRHRDVDDLAGALLGLDEIGRAGDALALDVGVGADDAGPGRGLGRPAFCARDRRARRARPPPQV